MKIETIDLKAGKVEFNEETGAIDYLPHSVTIQVVTYVYNPDGAK